MSDNQVKWQLLEDFAQAFNRHDLDGVMSRMTDDCVFLTAAGPEPRAYVLRVKTRCVPRLQRS